MARALRSGLVVIGAFALTAPAAHATTTVGGELGAGTDAGSAVRVTGDDGVNDMTITLTGPRRGQRGPVTMQITDRRGRVRREHNGPRCRARGRHTLACSGAGTTLAYVRLRGGDDRLLVRTVGAVPSTSPALPDG